MCGMERSGSGLGTWPRLRDTWWVVALLVLGQCLFLVGLLVRVRCELGMCPGSDPGRWDLDAVGGAPRLYITGLFFATVVVAGAAVARTTGRRRLWWSAVTAFAALLTAAKATSAHSVLETSDGRAVTLALGLGLTLLVLAVLGVAGRAVGVVGTRAVVLSLAGYATAALGLDAVTALVSASQDTAGAFSSAAATYVEEFGEAMTALVVLVTVRWHLPPAAGRSVGGLVAGGELSDGSTRSAAAAS